MVLQECTRCWGDLIYQWQHEIPVDILEYWLTRSLQMLGRKEITQQYNDDLKHTDKITQKFQIKKELRTLI